MRHVFLTMNASDISHIECPGDLAARIVTVLAEPQPTGALLRRSRYRRYTTHGAVSADGPVYTMTTLITGCGVRRVVLGAHKYRR